MNFMIGCIDTNGQSKAYNTLDAQNYNRPPTSNTGLGSDFLHHDGIHI